MCIILKGLGIERPAPITRVLLHGWIGFVMEATATWLDVGGLERERHLDLLEDSAAQLLTLAAPDPLSLPE